MGAGASASANGTIGTGSIYDAPTHSAAATMDDGLEQLDAAPRARLKQLNRNIVAAFEGVLAAQLATHEQGLATGSTTGGEAAVRELQQRLKSLDEQLTHMNVAINALRSRQAHEILITLMRNQRDEQEASARALNEAHQAAVASQGT